MTQANELPADLPTAHEVILTQSVAITELVGERDKLKKALAEAHAAFAKLRAGNRSEKLDDPRQQLLEFPNDPELQAALEAAKRQAAQEIETITYTRTQKKKDAQTRSDTFPAHLRREEVRLPIPADKQRLIDQGQLLLVGYEPREVMCHKPSEVYVQRFLEPVFALPAAPETIVDRVGMPAALTRA